jgi:hypothetical protein
MKIRESGENCIKGTKHTSLRDSARHVIYQGIDIFSDSPMHGSGCPLGAVH